MCFGGSWVSYHRDGSFGHPQHVIFFRRIGKVSTDDVCFLVQCALVLTCVWGLWVSSHLDGYVEDPQHVIFVARKS